MSDSLKVRFIASDPFGGGNLRSFWPSQALAKAGWASRAETWVPKPVPGEYDVVVIHRPLFLAYPKIVRDFQKAGFAVIVDEDDDLTRIHETKNEIGLQEWVPSAVRAHDHAMAMADGVTVTTDALAEVYGGLNANIRICRNYLPRELDGIRWYGQDGQVRVGWQGITATHAHDLEWIAPVWPELIAGALFTTVGDRKTPRMLGHHGPV